MARHPEIDAVVTGIVGCAGLHPTVAAIEAGKDICLANKETLIAGGPFVLPLAQKHGVHILPADSEHSAIFQCLQVRGGAGKAGGGGRAGERAGGQSGQLGGAGEVVVVVCGVGICGCRCDVRWEKEGRLEWGRGA